MQSIREWLCSNKNYDVGVTLYQIYGEVDALKDMFAQGYSAYRQQRLELVLREIVSSAKVSEVEFVVADADEPVVVVLEEPKSKFEPPEEQVKKDDDPYHDKWMPLYAKMKFLQHNLHNATSDEERGGMAFEILELERQCMVWWGYRDEYLRTGHKISEGEFIQENTIVDMNQLQRHLNNARSNLSKAKKKVNENPENSSAKGLVEKWQPIVDNLEKQLCLK